MLQHRYMVSLTFEWCIGQEEILNAGAADKLYLKMRDADLYAVELTFRANGRCLRLRFRFTAGAIRRR
jgi:hypothetical protein